MAARWQFFGVSFTDIVSEILVVRLSSAVTEVA